MKDQPGPPPAIGKILITLLANGTVVTDAKVPNHLYAIAMLEYAKRTMFSQAEKQQKPQIEIAASGDLPAPPG